MKKTKTKPFDTNLTEAEMRSRVMSWIRQMSRWWKPKQEAISRARVWRGQYKCEECGKVWPASIPPLLGKKRKRKNIQADHIESVVPINWWKNGSSLFLSYNWNEIMERMFVWPKDFQAICWECHSKKTKGENSKRRENKKTNK